MARWHFLGCSLNEVGKSSVRKKNCELSGTLRKKKETLGVVIRKSIYADRANSHHSTNINSLLNNETI